MEALTNIQQTAINAILAARPQGKRAMSYGRSFLNRLPRVLRGIRKSFERSSAKLGFNPEQTAQQWADVRDMVTLEDSAE
jgi:hypothetical protein